MKIKNTNLKWYVLKYDTNERQIINYNVLGNRFVELLHKAVKKGKVNTYEELKRFIDCYFIYYYMSRAEHEILVGGLFAKDINSLEKIDIYNQLKPNLDNITKYVDSELKVLKNYATQKKYE